MEYIAIFVSVFVSYYNGVWGIEDNIKNHSINVEKMDNSTGASQSHSSYIEDVSKKQELWDIEMERLNNERSIVEEKFYNDLRKIKALESKESLKKSIESFRLYLNYLDAFEKNISEKYERIFGEEIFFRYETYSYTDANAVHWHIHKEKLEFLYKHYGKFIFKDGRIIFSDPVLQETYSSYDKKMMEIYHESQRIPQPGLLDSF